MSVVFSWGETGRTDDAETFSGSYLGRFQLQHSEAAVVGYGLSTEVTAKSLSSQIPCKSWNKNEMLLQAPTQ